MAACREAYAFADSTGSILRRVSGVDQSVESPERESVALNWLLPSSFATVSAKRRNTRLENFISLTPLHPQLQICNIDRLLQGSVFRRSHTPCRLPIARPRIRNQCKDNKWND